MRDALTQRQMWKRLLWAWHRGPACQFEVASRYTQEFPDRADGWIVLADGLAGVARYREAQAALRKAARLAASDRQWFIAVQWGHLYREKRDEKAAERWYRKALALHSSTNTNIFLGAVLARQGRFAEAKRHHRRAIRLARDAARGAVRDCPDEAHYNLGLILRAQGRYAEAEDHLRTAIRLDPRYGIAKEALADVREAMRIRAAGEQ
jgi:tetratricopeptide (TPR) repeat protein